MSARIIAICDLCGAEQPLDTGGELLSEAGFEAVLERLGWKHREDALRHLCPAH